MKYFELFEFSCPCCGANEMYFSFIDKLDRARDYAGIVFVVNSGFRCEQKNKEIGGAPTSSHLRGYAADIKCLYSQSRFLMLRAFLHVGFNRIGIYPTFLHVDDDHSKPGDVIWVG